MKAAATREAAIAAAREEAFVARHEFSPTQAHKEVMDAMTLEVVAPEAPNQITPARIYCACVT
jgi:hypothetical protein